MQQGRGEKDLRFLFGRFSDETEIFSTYKEALSASEALKIFQETKRDEYLPAIDAHARAIMSFSARLSGRLKYVGLHWSESLASEYDIIVKRSAGDVQKELLRSIELLKKLGVASEESGQVQQITSKIIEATFLKFPTYCWKKLGYITYGIIEMAEEISVQATRSWGSPFDRRIYDYHLYAELQSDFKREYATYSGMPYGEADIPEDWREKYKGRKDETLDWGKDTLTNILEKMDFDAKVMAKAVVRLGGMLVCFAGALSKCASLVTVNPCLNDLSIKAMIVGGALAISPETARKIASKFGPS